jgi:lysosomal acid phosphatase
MFKQLPPSITLFIMLIITLILLLSTCSADGDKQQNKKQNKRSNSVEVNPLKLRTLFVLHRHGDRTPIRTYPRDPYNDPKYWPDGWGELTVPGKKRLYALGKFLRRRYADFLTDNPLEVKIRSSGASRCLNSVQCLLAGAYKPTGRYVIDPELNWQPFPVMTQPRIHDPMLNPQSACPAAERELNQIRNSPAVIAYREKSKQLMEYLTLNTGENVTDLTTAEYIHDDLIVERAHGYQLPAWANDNVLTELQALSDATFYFDGMTPKIQRFRTGVFFKDLKHHLNERSGPKDAPIRLGHQTPDYQHMHGLGLPEDGHPKSFHLYSTHDTMVSVVLQALGVFNMKAPPYAATIIFEHLQRENENLIRVFYLNETATEKMYPLTVKGCPVDGKNPCSMSSFLKAMKPLIVDDWNAECNSEDNDSSSSSLGNNDDQCHVKPKAKHADVLTEPLINDPVDHEKCSRTRSKSKSGFHK